MKIEVASVVALVCCSLIVSTSAQPQYTCAQFEAWGLNHFKCRSGGECHFDYFECDSILDCMDFSDEDHCEQQHKDNCESDFEGKVLKDGTPLQSYQCDNGMCILGCQRCDGKIDCSDFSDEIGCSPSEVIPPCKLDEF